MTTRPTSSRGEWPLIINLALRNFWRQRRRNASLLLAVAIGMAATLAGGFLIRGWQVSTLEETVERFGGSVLLQHKDWVDDPKTVSYTHLTLPTTPYV